MPQVQATIAAQLDVARDLVGKARFDAGVMLELLDSLPRESFRAQIRGAITHARLTATVASSGDPDHIAVARLALARVVTLLEWHVALGVGMIGGLQS